MTTRLYWDDSLLLGFSAPLVELVTRPAGPALVFDATAFYPEVGGQLADRATATWDGGSAPIVDGAEDDAGRVLHVLGTVDGALPTTGGVIRIDIDETRRRAHMSRHTGQHMLSRALLDLAGCDTRSSRLGDTACTIDTSAERIVEERLADAEALVSKIVLEDRPIRQLRPTPEELAKLPLRRDPKVSTNIRVIDVDGFDLSPCGGTHARRTGEVGPVRITGVEKYKGGHRISFLAGRQAFEDDARRSRLVAKLARDLTCGVDEVPAAIDKLRTDAKEAYRTSAAITDRLGALLAEGLLTRSGPVAIELVTGESAGIVRAMTAKIGQTPGRACLLAVADGDVARIFAAAGKGSTFDAGAAVKSLTGSLGGRGGGRPERAEGSVPASADLAAALRQLATTFAT